jgi:hypothetical protein
MCQRPDGAISSDPDSHNKVTLRIILVCAQKPSYCHSYATDPVATVIESHLGRDELKTSREAGGIRLSFRRCDGARRETMTSRYCASPACCSTMSGTKTGLVNALRSETVLAAAHAQGFSD